MLLSDQISELTWYVSIAVSLIGIYAFGDLITNRCCWLKPKPLMPYTHVPITWGEDLASAISNPVVAWRKASIEFVRAVEVLTGIKLVSKKGLLDVGRLRKLAVIILLMIRCGPVKGAAAARAFLRVYGRTPPKLREALKEAAEFLYLAKVVSLECGRGEG